MRDNTIIVLKLFFFSQIANKMEKDEKLGIFTLYGWL